MAAIYIDNYETGDAKQPVAALAAINEAKQLIAALTEAGFPPLLERSKSGRGYHIWLLFDAPISAHKVRLVLLDIINRSGISKEGAFDRIFPSQPALGGENLLASFILSTKYTPAPHIPLCT